MNMASRDYYRNMSDRLSRVMDDIDVNEEAVMSMRGNRHIQENLLTLSSKLSQNNNTFYVFGSQSEGTTTHGLKSDIDIVIISEAYNLIQDLNDWVPGKRNLLMIQDERFPGYCKLQLLKSDRPYPEDVKKPTGKFTTVDEAGRVILNHFYGDKVERHGPANIIYDVVGSGCNDLVLAIRCKVWPNGYKTWSRHHRNGTWPTPEMISSMKNSGCFVVQVAHRLDEKKSESWRISTSLAERCLMFSLNITQIRCCILVKMIVKTFIDPVIPEVISSYICKNLLFYCVENTRPEFWQESNLLQCVNQVLLIMLETVRCMNCPSYFNESINLMLGKINKDNQVALMGEIWKVLVSEGGFLLDIRFDNINKSIRYYHETIYQRKNCSRVEKCKYSLTRQRKLYFYLIVTIQNMLEERINQRDLMSLQNTMRLFALQGPFQYVTTTLLFPFLCSHLATVKAIEHIHNGETLSERTSFLYKRSIDSDVSSSRLRFASYLYCTGQLERARFVVEEAMRLMAADDCILVCGCDIREGVSRSIDTRDKSLSMQCLSPSRVSMCVMFSHAERRCCPRELQYEMYRSTQQEKLQRNRYGCDDWMDLACIDPSFYACFLLYMTNKHLGNRESSLLALEILEKGTPYTDTIKYNHHMDTDYNLLGQCYEYENRFEEAFACYCKSLRVRPTNNVARWHIVLLLNTVYQNE